ncbi:hypothetical protein JRQ81_006545 [Phrynocephalus forsythii]|uniref:hydroxyisourate hydrolase n=1 Tax=Phrynocephalus forsythii TaxID=171643 RepID=A0A9Q0XF52_9SAUR|nr:hypothetical protein JRQ81_006545 [Phrynocephalus forsythii]
MRSLGGLSQTRDHPRVWGNDMAELKRSRPPGLGVSHPKRPLGQALGSPLASEVGSVLCSEFQGAQREEAPSASLSIHALNLLSGLPATGLTMRFSRHEGPTQPWVEVLKSTTNTDGRLDRSSLAAQRLRAGTYKLHFDTGEYWQLQGYTSFYPYVEIVFTITGAERKVHIPLLLSPYSYTTYRGS